MKASDLRDFLSGTLNGVQLSRRAAAEIATYRAASEVKGSSMPVIVEGSEGILIDCGAVVRLCDAFLDGQLSTWDLEYVADALQMAVGTVFESETARDLLDRLTDLEGTPSLDRIREIRAQAEAGSDQKGRAL